MLIDWLIDWFKAQSQINYILEHLAVVDDSYKNVLDPLEIPRPKTNTPRNSTLFFLGHPW